MDKTDAARIAHDVALAAWFGGAWMGAVGLNGATIEIDDHTQRTRVANAGWFRWAPVVGPAVAVHLAASFALNRLPPFSGDPRRPLCRTRAGVTAAAVAATAGTGIAGRRVVRAGDVPVATAVTPIEATPDRVASAQRVLRIMQWLVPALTGVMWVLDALQDARESA